MKRLKKIMAILMVFALCITSGGLYVDSHASDTSVSGEVSSTVGGAYITYEMENTKQGDAEGTIYFHFEDLAQDSVSSIKYYWVDENGEKLDNYYHITEFSDSYLSPVSKTNTVADAANGFSLHKGAVIPYGANGLVADVTYTTSDGTSESVTINKCKYVTTVGDVAVSDSTLPVYKLSTVDYTIASEDEHYQMFYLSDFHNHYGWNGADGENYTNVGYEYAANSPQGKALCAVKTIIDNDDSRTLGIITTGDIVDGRSGGQGLIPYTVNGVEKQNERTSTSGYETVLATYYQAGLMEYMNFFANGNHDLIKSYASTEPNNNEFIEFIDKVYDANTALSSTYTEVELPTNKPSESTTDYYYDFKVGNDHYIFLSSPYEGEMYGIDQLTWFETLIKADNEAGTRTFVISHEPIYNTKVYATTSYMSDDQTLKALIEENSSNHETIWLSGHTHVYYHDNIQNVAIDQATNVSYVGLPSVLDTGLHSDANSNTLESQGMQVKVYEDKIVLVGRVLFKSKNRVVDTTSSTNIMPSAMYVIGTSNTEDTVPTVSINESAADNVLEIGSSVTASITSNDATAYQWYVGGTAIEGATDATYTITEDTPGGRLSVAVTTASDTTYYGIATAKVVEYAIHISTARELAKIGVDAEYPLDGNYVLDCDIDLSSYKTWTPIGTTSEKPSATNDSFKGSFDGAGHTISNMNVYIKTGCYAAGLFGGIWSSGTIQNLRITDSSAYGYRDGATYVGILFGYAEGTGNTTRLKISNISIENCHAYAESGNASNTIVCGGLAGGTANTTITDVYADTTVVAKYSNTAGGESKQICAGGILGSTWNNRVTITNAVFNGKLSSIYYAQNADNTYEPTADYTRQNPIFAYQSSSTVTATNFTNCYYNSDNANNVTTSNDFGYYNGEPLTSTELKNALSSTHMGSSTKWYNDAEDGLKLRFNLATSLEGFDGYTVIWDADDLAKIGKTDDYPLSGSYVLAQDINMGGIESWTPIGATTYDAKTAATTAFSGTFDGDGHKINDLTINVENASSTSYYGLFGTAYKPATFKNIVFVDGSVSVTSSKAVSAGMLLGFADDQIYAYNILIQGGQVSAATEATALQSNAGSVAGYAEPLTLENCYSDADVVSSYVGATVTESNQIAAGGFIGAAYKGQITSMSNCIFAGTVTSNYYSEGYENATASYNRVGSVLGMNNHAMTGTHSWNSYSLSDCYYFESAGTVAGHESSTPVNDRGLNGELLADDALLTSSLYELGLDSTYWFRTVDGGIKMKLDDSYDETTTIEIDSRAVFETIGKTVTDGGYPLDGDYILVNDIDLGGDANPWTPIGGISEASETGSFKGTFDGDGHTISNMTISVNADKVFCAGLFGSTYGAAEIKNFVLDGVNITTTGKYSQRVGCVVGGGTEEKIDNISYGAIVSNILVKNASITMSTSGTQIVVAGGIVGYSPYGKISNVCVDADLSVTQTGTDESAQMAVGGILGASWGAYATLENCIYDGNLSLTNASVETPTEKYDHRSSLFGFNSKATTNDANENTKELSVKNCYAMDTVVTSDTNARGRDGSALSKVDFGIRSIETLGLDSAYWIHTGYEPTLAISGEIAWDGTPDVNADQEVDICDLVRLAKFEDDNQIDGVLYRAANFEESTDDDAKSVNDNDFVKLREYLLAGLEDVSLVLNNTTASNFKLLGNTSANAQEFYMDYSYTGFSFEAYATGDVDVDFRYISQNAFPYAKLAVIVDGDVENREVIEISADGTYTIATVEAGYHTFEVVKITERNHDILKADKLSFKGMLKPAPTDAELNIQFIGDSITAASALDSYTTGNAAEEQAVQDILQGYAYQTATLLDADLSVRARSGIKTATAATALLPNASVDGETVIIEDDNYDIVVIGLGTNDNTKEEADKQAALKTDVTTMLTNARIAYPNAKIVWIYGMMIAVDNDTIEAAVNEFNAVDGNVYYFDGFTANQKGGAGHPDAEAHTVAAEALATYINSLIETGVANE